MPASDKYLPEQKANAVLWYTVCGDPKIVQHRFQDFYNHGVNHIDPPSADQIKEWYKNFRYLGFVDVQDAVVHEEATGEPMPHVEHHSKIGSAVSTVLHKLNNLFLDGPSIRTFHPYHMELIKFDDVNDLEERKIFAKTQLEHIRKWAPILRSMWFTGEAKFYTDGRVTCNNLIYTDTRKPDEKENLPHKVVKKYTHYDKPHITIWSAISSELVVGPIFFTGSISSEAYKQTLKNFVSDLHQISNENEHPILVQDDSKLHSNAEVVEFLEKEFPNHWIGTESKYAKWPHHSSDLSPINFFLWGYIKSRVYKTPIEPGDVDELKKRIETAFKNVTPDLLEEAIEEYKTRLERVVKTNGHLVDATIYGEEIDYDQLNVWGMYNWQYL